MEIRVIIGRLTRDPNVNDFQKQTGELKRVANFSIAVNRPFKNGNGEYDADFFNCVAYGKTADIVAQYCAKGKQVCLVGRTQNETYINKEGQEVRTDKFIIDKLELLGSFGEQQKPYDNTQQIPNNFSYDEINLDDLPF